jgi:hypothetical protein
MNQTQFRSPIKQKPAVSLALRVSETEQKLTWLGGHPFRQQANYSEQSTTKQH